jgi:putative redox protein
LIRALPGSYRKNRWRRAVWGEEPIPARLRSLSNNMLQGDTMAVVAHSLHNLQVDIQVEEPGRPGHRLLADEPVEDGGEDLGFSPYDLLLSSLAACKVMTVQLYARRKGWPLTGVTLRLDHRTITAAECDDCVSPPEAKVERIDCEIAFEGDLDQAQLDRLRDIADRCPVHRTITGEVKIHTALAQEILTAAAAD